jgi:hypothetical protein
MRRRLLPDHWHPSPGQRYLVLVAVLVGVAALVLIVAKTGQGKTEEIVVGVLGSIIASILILGVNFLTAGDSDRASAHAVEDAVGLLTRQAPLLDDGHTHKVQAVRPKGEYERDEWIALLRDAQEELYIVGHAVDSWCDTGVQRDFVAAIDRLARDGGTIRLVTLPEGGTVTRFLAVQRGKQYDERIRRTLDVLGAIHSNLPAKHRGNLHVSHLREDTTMPYTVAGNEHTLIIATYPIAGQDSDRMPAIKLAARSPLGAAVRDDLDWLIKKLTTPHVW